MQQPADDNFVPNDGHDSARHPQEHQHEPAGRTSTAPNEPSEHDEVGSSDNDINESAQAAELFQQSTGLNKLPDAGMSHMAAKAAELQTGRAEGISRAQNIVFANENGEVKLGLQYTNNGGTFFKTAQGLTFRVEPNDMSGFDLYPLNAEGEIFSAVNLRVMNNLFSVSMEDLAGLFKSRPILPEVDADAVFARPTLKELVPPPEPMHFVEDEMGQPSDNFAELNSNEFAQTFSEPEQSYFEPETGDFEPETSGFEPAESGFEPETSDFEPETSGFGPETSGFEAAESAFEPEENASELAGVVGSEQIDDSIAEEQLIVSAQEEFDEKARQEAEQLERELIKQQIKKRDDERRRRYVVKDKDTLDSIAIKQFRDVRLSQLIYEINKHLLPLKTIRGKQVRALKARMVIFLPTGAEIEKFRESQSSTGVSQTQDDTDLAEDVTSTESILEDDTEYSDISADSYATTNDTILLPETGPPSNINTIDNDHVNYTVRLGDTLKSIATLQPQLLDHSLWILLAELNGLSTSIDHTGDPECKLTRGMRLKLPNRSEVEAFRARKRND